MSYKSALIADSAWSWSESDGKSDWQPATFGPYEKKVMVPTTAMSNGYLGAAVKFKGYQGWMIGGLWSSGGRYSCA